MILQAPLINGGHDTPTNDLDTALQRAMNEGHAIKQIVHRIPTPDPLMQHEDDTSSSSSDAGDINPHRRTLEAALKGAMADSLQDGFEISLTPDHEAHAQPILTDLQKALLSLDLKDSHTGISGALPSDIEDML